MCKGEAKAMSVREEKGSKKVECENERGRGRKRPTGNGVHSRRGRTTEGESRGEEEEEEEGGQAALLARPNLISSSHSPIDLTRTSVIESRANKEEAVDEHVSQETVEDDNVHV